MPLFFTKGRLRVGAALAVAAAALACSSCGSGHKKLYPVEGKVLFNGQPLKGAYVFMHPTDVKDSPSNQPHGVASLDGTFHIGTYNTADGAPPGAYTVTVYWSPQSPIGGDEGGYIPFLRYLSPLTSPLHVEIKKQPTVLEPFQLTLK